MLENSSVGIGSDLPDTASEKLQAHPNGNPSSPLSTSMRLARFGEVECILTHCDHKFLIKIKGPKTINVSISE
ncbi:hypothetical protein CEXT_229551 [Caerostris extrusa]|uniref:Uncharacterized protein n=1 Tax=Caerostris extrusa TaxID=172846 RepID=A0AAV4MHX3_CAEEX|nr:hypothetical protein CEXT_229551 [Caerostris extrusa]